MIADISFYLDKPVEEGLLLLITEESPLNLEKKFEDHYILNSKNQALDGHFLYTSTDSEIISENKLHIAALKILSFKAESELYYSQCILNPEKINEFKKIIEYIIEKDICVYMTATDKSGNEMIIKGHNPLTNTEIQNANLKHNQRIF